MGLDGGYVRARKSQDADSQQRCFKVITGKSIADDGSSKCFGLVNNYDEKPKRRVFEVLKSQGMQPNQQITFFSDGGDTVRDLQLYLNPQAEHLLDWFHITMRITAMNQMAKGVNYHYDWQQEDILKTLESIKWYLWHGNVFQALQEIESLTLSLDTDATSPEQNRLLKKAEEFETYITNNQQFITNYGERYRNGERISTGFVESTVNQVISKRMVKKQQMPWTRKGRISYCKSGRASSMVIGRSPITSFRAFPHFLVLSKPSSSASACWLGKPFRLTNSLTRPIQSWRTLSDRGISNL